MDQRRGLPKARRRRALNLRVQHPSFHARLDKKPHEFLLSWGQPKIGCGGRI